MTNTTKPGCIVLLYHRVSETPHTLNVSPRHFGEHLEVMRTRADVVTLDQVVEKVSAGGSPRRGIAVSFDDGYVDNLTSGVPLLERYDVPATVFVAAGYVGDGRGFWWDRLAHLVDCWRVSHGPLAVDLGGGVTHWQVDADDEQVRRELEDQLQRALMVLESGRREDVLSRISEHLGTVQRGLVADQLPMSRDQVRQLVGDLVSVGGHTMTHRRLLGLSSDQLEFEVGASRRSLMEVTGKPVDHFSYPFGWRGTDYDDAAVAAVRKAGYHGAFCSRPAPARRGDSLYELPRLWVNDMDGDEFAKQLHMCWGR